MLIITSQTYGTITIPLTLQQSERYEANVPTYARDNTSNNTRDSVGSGAIMQPFTLNFTGILSNNDGGIIPYKYDIEQTRQILTSIFANSELLTIIFGVSNSPVLFAANPITWDNVVIKSMQIDADTSTGATYNVSMTLVQQILVDVIYNPEVINVPSGGTDSNGNSDVQKKSLSPQNNGNVTPSDGPVSWSDIEQDFQKFEGSL